MLYLDNAATTYPKPEIIKEAVKEWLDNGIGSPGRGSQEATLRANNRLTRIRDRFARYFGVGDEYRVIFTYSGTDALNLAFKGFLEQGDHVIISQIEHNSVIRPLRHMELEGKIKLDVIPCDVEGYVRQDLLWRAFNDKTKLVVISHASNVLGTVQPVAEIGAEVRKRGAYLLVDVAQSTGIIPTNLNELNADMLATAGHKGLYGLPGTGLLILGQRIEKLESWRQGGTGYNSESEYQPVNWPEKFESGTMNMPGIISMEKGLDFIESVGLDKIEAQSKRLFEYMWEELSKIPNAKLYGPSPDKPRVGVLSMNMHRWEADDIADILHHNYKIQIRSGLQCAPMIHKMLGTSPTGTVRISPGYYNTEEDIRELVRAIRNLSYTQVDWMFD